jgi:hypothetical protein
VFPLKITVKPGDKIQVTFATPVTFPSELMEHA